MKWLGISIVFGVGFVMGLATMDAIIRETKVAPTCPDNPITDSRDIVSDKGVVLEHCYNIHKQFVCVEAKP